MRELPLVGRGRHVATISQLVDDVVAGTGVLSTIVGAAGCGKTRLLAETAELASRRGLRVLSAACPMVGGRPLSPLAECLSLLGTNGFGTVVDRFIVSSRTVALGPHAPQDQLIAVIDAAVDVLEAVSLSSPSFVLLDDLQWAEPTTMQVVAALSARLPHLPVGLVLAARPVPPPSRLLDLAAMAEAAGRSITVGDLDHDNVRELIVRLHGAPPGERLAGELQRVGGNPLFVAELLASLAEDERLAVVEHEVELIGDGASLPELDVLVARRIASLDPELQELLRVAAVLGDTFAPVHVAVAVGRPVLELTRSLEHMMDAGFFEVSGDELTFRHDLVHETVYMSIAEPIRRDLHREVADRLTAAGVPAAVIARHVLVGAREGDASAAGLLRQVGGEVAPFAPATAVLHLTRALEVEPDPVVKAELRGELARARFWCGESSAADQELRSAVAELPAGTLRDELAGLRAQVLILLGRMREAADLLEEHGKAVDSPAAALHTSDAAVARLLDADLPAARELATRALDVALVHGYRRAECQALGVLAWSDALAGQAASALDLATRAVERAETDAGLDAHRDIPFLFLAQTLSWLDRSAETEQAVRIGLERGRSLGMAWHEPIYASVLAEEHVRAGRWDDALADAESVVRVSLDTGTSLTTPYSFAATAHILRRRGDVNDATEHIETAMRLVSEGATQGADFVFWEWGELQVAAESTAQQGTDSLRSLWLHLGDLGVIQRWRQFATSYARALRCHRRQHLDDLRVAGERIVSGDGSYATSIGAYLLALHAEDDDGVRTAIDAHPGAARPLERGEMLEELALLTVVRSRRRATEIARAACEIYDGVGASADATRLRTRLAIRGVNVGRRRPERRPRFGWDSLTPSELAAVGRVASGATNAEIADDLGISVRTVESHLHHAYVKVGCSNRVELAVEAAQRHLAPPTPQ